MKNSDGATLKIERGKGGLPRKAREQADYRPSPIVKGETVHSPEDPIYVARGRG